MTIQQLFIQSERALTNIVDQITDDQWNQKVPTWIQEKEMSLKEVINYHAYDDIWVPDTLAGKTIAEVGNKYDGDLLKDDPKGNWHAIVEKSIAAVEQLTDVEKMAHLTYGDFPVKEYLLHISTFRAMRTLDFARFFGMSTREKLSAEFVQTLYELLVPQAEQWRQWGVFGPEVKVSEDASIFDKLLGITGRNPAEYK